MSSSLHYATSFIPPSKPINNHKLRHNYNVYPQTQVIHKRASLFSTIQHYQSALGNGEGSTNVMSNDDDDDDNNSEKRDSSNLSDDKATAHPLTSQPHKFISKLESFISNISRNRMTKKKRSLLDPKKSAKDDTNNNNHNVNDALINACTSLVYFLNNEAGSLSTNTPPSSFDNSINILQQQLTDDAVVHSIRESLEMVLVQAVRAASEVGDFVLINKLIHAAVGYATAVAKQTNNNVPLLTPRIFGEVITSISKTKASHSKVKSLWNLFIRDVAANNNDTRILSSAPSSYELNAMLTSLSERNKVSAALTLYRRMIEGVDGIVIDGDAYSASILFAMLADSIANGGTRATTIRDNFSRLPDDIKDDDDVDSPCWQWKEAISILNTFSSAQLNNFAYAALLKVNEQATEVYSDVGARHNGVQCAMSVLERMKVSNSILIMR
jgi:hypothetical protein